MTIWRAEGQIKELGPDGYSTVRRECVDGPDWDGLVSVMARFELNLSIDEPTRFIEWNTLSEIRAIHPINNYVLDIVAHLRDVIYRQSLKDNSEAPQ